MLINWRRHPIPLLALLLCLSFEKTTGGPFQSMTWPHPHYQLSPHFRCTEKDERSEIVEGKNFHGSFESQRPFVQFQLELLNFFRAFLHGSGNRFHSFPSLVMEKSDRKFNSFSITLFHHSFPSLFSITLFHHCC